MDSTSKAPTQCRAGNSGHSEKDVLVGAGLPSPLTQVHMQVSGLQSTLLSSLPSLLNKSLWAESSSFLPAALSLKVSVLQLLSLVGCEAQPRAIPNHWEPRALAGVPRPGIKHMADPGSWPSSAVYPSQEDPAYSQASVLLQCL